MSDFQEETYRAIHKIPLSAPKASETITIGISPVTNDSYQEKEMVDMQIQEQMKKSELI